MARFRGRVIPVKNFTDLKNKLTKHVNGIRNALRGPVLWKIAEAIKELIVSTAKRKGLRGAILTRWRIRRKNKNTVNLFNINKSAVMIVTGQKPGPLGRKAYNAILRWKKKVAPGEPNIERAAWKVFWKISKEGKKPQLDLSSEVYPGIEKKMKAVVHRALKDKVDGGKP